MLAPDTDTERDRKRNRLRVDPADHGRLARADHRIRSRNRTLPDERRWHYPKGKPVSGIFSEPGIPHGAKLSVERYPRSRVQDAQADGAEPD
ncbi:hypothetical protein D3C84_1177960 [compost metagenome]